MQYLEFEKPLEELESKLADLREDGAAPDSPEVQKLERRLVKLRKSVFRELTPWHTVQLARHPDRPTTLDYIGMIAQDFVELHGDRGVRDDAAIVGGFCRLDGKTVLVVGHQKGHTSNERVARSFGMARPEGFRKALRLMKTAERFGKPVVCLVDTPGAYPGVDAEERGQAEAIARSTDACLALGAPNVALVIGEGGSGGAIAIATANKVLMMEHAIYSVISPEGAASILWRDTAKAQDAATNMKITAQDLLKFGIIDAIVKEPPGGAHRDPEATIGAAGDAIADALSQLAGLDGPAVRKARRDKFLAIGRSL